jgi:hypothetical protein
MLLYHALAGPGLTLLWDELPLSRCQRQTATFGDIASAMSSRGWSQRHWDHQGPCIICCVTEVPNHNIGGYVGRLG